MDPWAFAFHPAAWLAVVVVALAYVGLCRHVAHRGVPGARPSRRQWWLFVAALAALALALTWPVADLAAHWSLTALIAQRLLLTLAVAPLLLLATPAPVLGWLTAPAWLDDTLAFVTRPAAAIVVFTAVVVGTLFTPAVAAQSSSAVVRGVTDAALVLAGCVLWGPVLRHIPGASRPIAVGIAAYLFIQSVVPGFPAVIFIFSRHPLYPGFAGSHQAIGLAPLSDQRLAGVVTKLATIPVLWTVAWITLTRAHRADALGGDADPLVWVDVERRLQRAERQERRAARRRFRPARTVRAIPPLPRSLPTAPGEDPAGPGVNGGP